MTNNKKKYEKNNNINVVENIVDILTTNENEDVNINEEIIEPIEEKNIIEFNIIENCPTNNEINVEVGKNEEEIDETSKKEKDLINDIVENKTNISEIVVEMVHEIVPDVETPIIKRSYREMRNKIK